MKHTRKLSRARKHAAKALNVFTKAEKRLHKSNEQIATHVQDIDAFISELSATKNALVEHHASNTRVIGQIAKITRG